MAECWKRGAQGAETNAEGVRIESAPMGTGMRWMCSPLQPTRGLGERRELGVITGSGAEPQPKTNLVHFVAARRTPDSNY